MAYSKLFSSIVHSSLWTEEDHVRLLFVTLLAIADREGFVYGSRMGLERLANIDYDDEARNPWQVLMNPDSDSSDLMRNPENQGRRIEEVPGGFRILNYSYYRSLRNEDDRREQNREAQKRYREKVSTSKPKSSQDKPPSASVSQDKQSPSASASALGKCTEEEAVQYCTTANLTKADGQWFWNKCEGCGWKNNGKPIRDWRRTITAWRLAKIFPSQKEAVKKWGGKPTEQSELDKRLARDKDSPWYDERAG